MQSTKIIMALCVIWKNHEKPAVTLDFEDVDGIQNIGGSTGDN